MQYSNLDFNPEFSIQFRIHFHPQNLKVKEITHDFNHDLLFYYSHKVLCMPEDKSVFRALGIYNFAYTYREF
jgi:hypothetical protein